MIFTTVKKPFNKNDISFLKVSFDSLLYAKPCQKKSAGE